MYVTHRDRLYKILEYGKGSRLGWLLGEAEGKQYWVKCADCKMTEIEEDQPVDKPDCTFF